MIYGQSGTGKSTSLRNFSRDDVAIVNVSGKPLPFRNNLKTYKSDNYQAIMKAIQAAPQKSIVDCGNIVCFRNLEKATNDSSLCGRPSRSGSKNIRTWRVPLTV